MVTSPVPSKGQFLCNVLVTKLFGFVPLPPFTSYVWLHSGGLGCFLHSHFSPDLISSSPSFGQTHLILPSSSFSSFKPF